ncbi:hypothetical protein CEP51_011511 [Fusarium floridanum]|uniref:Uncharacterized protein n=1 Tax=Fusarium floridanum TaxID=1325733 RepID=A0A428RAW3_9HYPO|nr:hypothetical protein CEP51_011511 [Fusarium floridanum]
MSSRSFSTTTKKFVQLIGRVTLRDVADINGSNGPEWANKVQNVAETIENEVGDSYTGTNISSTHTATPAKRRSFVRNPSSRCPFQFRPGRPGIFKLTCRFSVGADQSNTSTT